MNNVEDIASKGNNRKSSNVQELRRNSLLNQASTSQNVDGITEAKINQNTPSHPLDIVVQKIQNVVINQPVDSSDEEDDGSKNATREINYALKLQGFKVIGKENGADCEIITLNHRPQHQQQIPSSSYEDSNEITVINDDDDEKKNLNFNCIPRSEDTVYAQLLNKESANNAYVNMANVGTIGASSTPATSVTAFTTIKTGGAEVIGNKSNFRKGHRRACSMPNAHRERAILVVADDQIREEGSRKRHVVRYRLHPYKPSPQTDEAVNSFIDAVNLTEFPFSLNDPNDDLEMDIDETHIVCNDVEKTRTIVRRFWEAKWKKQNFELLPEWLQDNEYLRTGHRPPLASFTSCFKSIFSLHTETGNIWTHMYGCVAFIGAAAWFLSQPATVIAWREKIIFSFFFTGAIVCLGFSFTFHTLQCHSEGVAGLFSKLDYSGISMLIVGSFVPWIYYSFYCRALPMTIYISMITIMGISALVVSLWDKFAAPKYRALRGSVFLAMGLSSVIPAMHLTITDGFKWMFDNASLHWLLLMGALYITGACVYMTRFPERICPGKCDYFCHSHQFFHMFVIVAAFVHFHGVTEMVMRRLQDGSCTEQLLADYGTADYRNFLDRWFRPY